MNAKEKKVNNVIETSKNLSLKVYLFMEINCLLPKNTNNEILAQNVCFFTQFINFLMRWSKSNTSWESSQHFLGSILTTKNTNNELILHERKYYFSATFLRCYPQSQKNRSNFHQVHVHTRVFNTMNSDQVILVNVDSNCFNMCISFGKSYQSYCSKRIMTNAHTLSYGTKDPNYTGYDLLWEP